MDEPSSTMGADTIEDETEQDGVDAVTVPRAGGTANDDAEEEEEDILTVFHAEPLVVWDAQKGPVPIVAPDFGLERKLIQDAIDSTNPSIDVQWEKTTTDRIGSFLARIGSHVGGVGRVIHFSCHNVESILTLEQNGWGIAQFLQLDHLKEWMTMADAGSYVKFVFVSAVHPRPIARAFVDAGIPHVVACVNDAREKTRTPPLIFQKAFYRALVAHRTIEEAFDLAKQQVIIDANSSQWRAEMSDKVCLLPNFQSHAVPVFFGKKKKNNIDNATASAAVVPTTKTSVSVYPPTTPDDIKVVGTDQHEKVVVDMFRLIQSIKTARLIRVTSAAVGDGGRGIAKCVSLLKTCCRYLNERVDLIQLEQIFWVPYLSSHIDFHYGNIDDDDDDDDDDNAGGKKKKKTSSNDENKKLVDFGKAFNDFYEALQDDLLVMEHFSNEVKKSVRTIIQFCACKKSLLLIIQATAFTDTGMEKLQSFLRDLLLHTMNTKVVIIQDDEPELIGTSNMPCMEANVQL